MSKKIIQRLVILIFFSALFIPLLTFSQTSATNSSDEFKKTSADRFRAFTSQAGLGYGTPKPLELVIADIVRVIIGFVGIILVLLLIYGGLTWMTSGGNEQKIEKAKGILTNSVIGLAITLTAYSIAYYVSLWLQNSLM